MNGSVESQAMAAEIVMRGILSMLPPEEQEKVKAAQAELDAVIKKHGDHGQLAAMFISIEVMKDEVPAIVKKAAGKEE